MVNVVIVEDDHDGAEVLEEYLRLKGINVIAKGYNGLEAVQLYKKHRPDVVLLDIDMPDYDGMYGLEHIKKINSQAKVVILTSFCSDHNEKKIKLFRVTEIAEKPCSFKQLEKFLKIVKNIV